MNRLIITVYIFLFLFLFFGGTNQPVSAGNNETLSKIENEIFGFDYKKESTNNRLIRLEKAIYGQSQNGDINKRIKKISSDISADVIGLEIPPVKDTFLAEENTVEDSSVSYPIVDEIEMKLFNTTYKNRDFHTRIVTIEKKLFGKIYDVEDYSTRMDRIKSEVIPESMASKNDNYEVFDNTDDNYSSPYYEDDFDALPKKRKGLPFGQKNYTRQYANYGDSSSLFRNRRYSESIPDNAQLEDEIAQMEYDIFGTEFSNETTQSRIKRLNSVNKAKKSSKKYDSQKFSQHVSTAMEIGAMILMVLAMIL